MRFVMGAIAVSVLTAACNPAAPSEVVTSSNTEFGNTLISGTSNSASASPERPSPPTLLRPASTTTTQSGSAAATFALSNTSVTESTSTDAVGQRHYQYYPWFVLTETSGRSGATLSRIQIAAEGGQPWDNCFDARVNAGATFDASVEESCYTSEYIGSPNVRTDSPVSSLTVILTFVDDQGTPGTLTVRFSMN